MDSGESSSSVVLPARRRIVEDRKETQIGCGRMLLRLYLFYDTVLLFTLLTSELERGVKYPGFRGHRRAAMHTFSSAPRTTVHLHVLFVRFRPMPYPFGTTYGTCKLTSSAGRDVIFLLFEEHHRRCDGYEDLPPVPYNSRIQKNHLNMLWVSYAPRIIIICYIK